MELRNQCNLNLDLSAQKNRCILIMLIHIAMSIIIAFYFMNWKKKKTRCFSYLHTMRIACPLLILQCIPSIFKIEQVLIFKVGILIAIFVIFSLYNHTPFERHLSHAEAIEVHL